MFILYLSLLHPCKEQQKKWRRRKIFYGHLMKKLFIFISSFLCASCSVEKKVFPSSIYSCLFKWKRLKWQCLLMAFISLSIVLDFWYFRDENLSLLGGALCFLMIWKFHVQKLWLIECNLWFIGILFWKIGDLDYWYEQGVVFKCPGTPTQDQHSMQFFFHF